MLLIIAYNCGNRDGTQRNRGNREKTEMYEIQLSKATAAAIINFGCVLLTFRDALKKNKPPRKGDGLLKLNDIGLSLPRCRSRQDDALRAPPFPAHGRHGSYWWPPYRQWPYPDRWPDSSSVCLWPKQRLYCRR